MLLRISRPGFFSSMLLIMLFILITSCLPIKQTSKQVIISNRMFNVELAVTEAEHVKGLSGHAPLLQDQGMMFIFPDEQIRYFWMKDMLFPLDIAFISSGSKIVGIKRNFQPCTPSECQTYSSKAPAMYVIEVRAGALDGINMGDKVTDMIK